MRLLLQDSFSDLPKNFNVRLQAARELTELSARQAAKKFGKSYDVWIRWERNVVPNVSGLQFLRSAAGLDLNHFFCTKPQQPGLKKIEMLSPYYEIVRRAALRLPANKRTLAVELAMEALTIIPEERLPEYIEKLAAPTRGRSAKSVFGELLDWHAKKDWQLDNFHGRFQFFRRKAGLSILNMAEYLDVWSDNVKLWEVDSEASGRVFFRIAEFGINLNWLVEGSENFHRVGWDLEKALTAWEENRGMM